MPRILIILTAATVLIFGGMFYQYREQQKEADQLQLYQTVLLEKTELIFKQAQDADQPIQVNVTDPRLQGDYQVMANFVLSQMIQNAEARNAYIRQLKALDWDRFLDIDRLAADKKQDYKATADMLKNVHAAVESYAQKMQQFEQNSLEQAKNLPIESRYRHQLIQSLRESQQSDDSQALYALEQQSLAKADAIFLVLKNNKWEKKGKTFMFYEDAPLAQFNALYKEISALNQQMRQVTAENQEQIAEKL
ncbi:hypothetical protein [Acinetobacter sp. ANC 3813]|uniref:hypothetical protein n=1 Tax=Acinetobacter sp. ANC 3813 TaxID=1977873 RepID=UPI000A34C3CB|nr:hypothetical protein [Acinetobacter sp. ANC 3813]OTG86847.1 hypothetical protein B9T34_17355 [Acinetobacter sp. ANC 3813]